MMSESLESRRFERKTVFDVPLPMKKPGPGRDAAAPPMENPPPPAQAPNSTMAFSLMTRKGNKQQV